MIGSGISTGIFLLSLSHSLSLFLSLLLSRFAIHLSLAPFPSLSLMSQDIYRDPYFVHAAAFQYS